MRNFRKTAGFVVAGIILIASIQVFLQRKNVRVKQSRIPGHQRATSESATSSIRSGALARPGVKKAGVPRTDRIAVCLESLGSNDIKESQKAVQELLTIGNEAVGPLIEALSSESTFLKGQAVFLLGKIGNKAAAGPLAALLRYDQSSYIRRNAASALGGMRDTAAYEALVAATQDDDPGVRARAAESLGRSGELTAGQALVDLLRLEEEMSVRFASVRALGALKDPLTAGPLAAELALKADRLYKNDIARALGNIGSPVALPALQGYLAELRALSVPEPVLQEQVEMAIDIVEEAIESINRSLYAQEAA